MLCRLMTNNLCIYLQKIEQPKPRSENYYATTSHVSCVSLFRDYKLYVVLTRSMTILYIATTIASVVILGLNQELANIHN